MSVDIESVKILRKETGAAYSACQKALKDGGGNLEKARECLRKMGIVSANKKMDRTTGEGLIMMATDGEAGYLVSLGCETDFVARNVEFQSLLEKITRVAVDNRCDSAEALRVCDCDGVSVVDAIVAKIAIMGEAIRLNSVQRIFRVKSLAVGYVHNAVTPKMGKLGAIVLLESNADVSVVQEIGKMVAMHIVAMKPVALDVDDLDQALLSSKKDEVEAEVKKLGKPVEIVNKIISGHMDKFYQESLLMRQYFVADPQVTVGQYVQNRANELGREIKIVGYIMSCIG